VSEEEAEEAKEKFMAVQMAYELLCEGMENGGAGMKGAVFSGGDLEYAGGPETQQAADEGNADAESAMPAMSTGLAGAGTSTGAGTSSGISTSAGAGVGAGIGAGMGADAGAGAGAAGAVSDAPTRGPHTATPSAVNEGAVTDGAVNDGAVKHGTAPEAAVNGVAPVKPSLLNRSEVDLLLRGAGIQAALRGIAADPAAVMTHTDNAVLLGLLFTLATEGWDQPAGTPHSASAGGAAGAVDGGGGYRAGILDRGSNAMEAEEAD
jgi:hypothetical protein